MWQGIRGQDDAVEQFRAALASGRLATTYLFVGPDGVGKRTFALKLAKVLFCPDADKSAMLPCGRCESCRLAEAGTHPDLHLVARKPDDSVLKLEYFIGRDGYRHREGLCFELSLRPLVSSRKVAIIDEADLLNPESANALLKTLEEPPPGAVIILLGTSRSRQLSTILSRSQLVRFHPLAPAEMAEVLAEQKLVSDSVSASELAARSEGSVTRAKELADPALWMLRGRLVSQWLEHRMDCFMLAKEVEELAAAAGKESGLRRSRLRQIFGLTVESLRTRLRHECEVDDRQEIVDVIMAAIDRTLESQEQLDRNANQSSLVECWLDDLSRMVASAGTKIG
jgi:DNA polymerase-3 subunit delta'